MNKYFSFVYILLLSGSLLFLQACEEDKPQTSAKDHLDLAQLYFKQGSFKASIIEGKNALRLEPNNIEVLTTMATVLLKLNEPNAASQLITKATEIDVTNQNTKLLLAKAQFSQRKLFSARNTFENIDSSAINNISEYQSLHADLLLTSNNREEAKKWYLKAHASDNKNIESIIGAAKSSLLLKQLEDVNKYTALAVETAPSDINALLWQARVFMLQKKHADAEAILSRAMIELERYDTLTANKYTAIDMLAKALVAQGKVEESFTYSNYLAQSRPGQVQAAFKDAINLVSKGGNLSEAEKAFQDVLKQAPKHRSSGIILGMINYEKGDYTQAEDYLGKFANSENTPLRSKKLLALTKIKLNKADEAIKIIMDNIKQHKDDADLHALLGFAYLTKKDPDNSIKSLQQAIKLSDNNSIYHANLARAFLTKKQFKPALKSAKKALKIKPNSEQAKLVLITAYALSKDLKRAEKTANDWLSTSPKNITANLIMASLLLENKKPEKARTFFLKTLSIEPYNLIANMNMIKFNLQENKFDRALERLALVINKYPENTQALRMLAKLSIASKNVDKAINIIESANNKHPFAINSRLVLAQLMLTNNKPEKTLIIIDDVTKLDNKNKQAYLLKAKAYIALNNIKSAKDTFLLLASLDPENPQAYAELGRLYLNQKDFKNAEAFANKSLKINPEYFGGHIVLAATGIETNNFSMSLKSINALKNIAPDSHIPYEMEADIQTKQKNYKKAIEILKNAWNKNQNIKLANKLMLNYLSDNQKAIAFDAWNELASSDQKNLKLHLTYSLVLHENEQSGKALKVLESQLKTYPDNAILLNNLANLYLDTGNSKALEFAKKAYSKLPDSPAIQDTLGWIYTKQEKNYKAGIPLLEKAYEKTSAKEIKEHLVQALTASGDVAKANKLK